MTKVISQEECESVEKPKAQKKILWNVAQAKEKEASEASEKEVLVGGRRGERWRARGNEGENREHVVSTAACDMAPANDPWKSIKDSNGEYEHITPWLKERVASGFCFF